MAQARLRVLQPIPSLGALGPATLARHSLLPEILPPPRSLRLPLDRHWFPTPMDLQRYRLPVV